MANHMVGPEASGHGCQFKPCQLAPGPGLLLGQQLLGRLAKGQHKSPAWAFPLLATMRPGADLLLHMLFLSSGLGWRGRHLLPSSSANSPE